MPTMDRADKQGGKVYGQILSQQAEEMDKINMELIDDSRFKDIENLQEKLASFKDQMDLKRMLERLGQAKTHREVMKMITQVDTTNSGTINYRDFVDMMLGTRTSVLRMILMFEEQSKEKEKPKGPPPQKSLDQLP